MLWQTAARDAILPHDAASKLSENRSAHAGTESPLDAVRQLERLSRKNSPDASSVKRIIRYLFGCRNSGATSERPRLLLFDFDGTIADTFDAAFAIINVLASEFGFRPLARADLDKVRDMRTRQFMRFLGIPMAKMSRIARRGSQEIHARMPGIEPLPGVPALLRELHAAGYELGIVTSNSEANVRMFLEKHDLNFFDVIRSSSKLLGKAHELRAVIKTRRIRAGDILFIGDETRDIEAAQKAGIPAAAVTWGYNSRLALEGMKPNAVFETPEELARFLIK